MSSPLRPLLVLLAVSAAALAATAVPARATTICGEGTYAYAGYTGDDTVSSGVSATIEQAGPLAVHAGHVAGWIGVSEPNDANGWIQVGLSAFPGQATSEIYYEVTKPGHDTVYHEVAADVGPGAAHTFAVLEQHRRPGWWRVWVDGRPVSSPVYLAGSHGRWTPQVLGESWAGEVSGACNAYSYAFSSVKVRPAEKSAARGLTGPLYHDSYYVVTDRSRSGFVASSFGVANFRGAAVQAPSASASRNATGAASRPPQSTHAQSR